ncbi:MAG TPA: periplasmic heavy metal sensor [Candidatus Binatia bacterium]|nr:periplasmic heavy metal sensor [Candidatus Binatia bacterium]
MTARWKALAAGLALAGCVTTVLAHGLGRGFDPEMMGGDRPGMLFPMLLRALDLTAAQKAQVHAVMERHRPTLESLFGQMHAANDALAAKLLAPGPVQAADLAPNVQQVAALRQQLTQEWVTAALDLRGILTAAQLAKAAEVHQRLGALRAQMQQLFAGEKAGQD